VTEVVELSAPPGNVAIYRRAVLGQVRRRSATGLPDTTLVLRGVSVDRDRLAAYDRVCGYRLTDRLPPTYPHVLAFPLAMQLMSRVDFPLRVVGVVHVANRIEVLRPVDAGERLELTVRATDLRPHGRGRQFDLRATASVDDEVVWRGISTYLHKDKAAGPRDAPPTGNGAVSDGGIGDDATGEDGSGSGGSGEDGSGDGVPDGGTAPERGTAPPATAIWRVGREFGPRYAHVSGDHNPIHTSRLGARAFGFPGTIAHGMWSKARCLAALEGRLPDAYLVDVAFKLPVLLPASVGFSAEQLTDGWTIGLHDARSGRPHLTGRITG
jgi:acyl dehydratase